MEFVELFIMNCQLNEDFLLYDNYCKISASHTVLAAGNDQVSES